jgi:hypothetical protein
MASVRVSRISKYLSDGALFHHSACVHDRYIVGQVGDNREVVRDVQRRDTVIPR